MSKMDDGGPAFPVEDLGLNGTYGMSMRDWFAGQALPSAVEDYDRITRIGGAKGPVLPWSNAVLGTRETIIARQAYTYADAMLDARK